ncbi:MAG: YedE-related selenium metabolism membrane protein [Actinobacteria bacterium]|nr:YedE-related selenium metabolism membrane protein [Actinomycetota bacterium]MCL5887884.1 YedE-related selenium metabolism membrane protein [Actinomycetota bacterium]
MRRKAGIGVTAWFVGGAGIFIGVVASWLVSQGNPGNMGVCVACFLRDITGFFAGVATGQAGTAYIRPEIIGIILGAVAAAALTREFRPRGGSGTLLRFVLGFIFMVSALIFLGCTVRAWLRLAGGDLNAIWGILGIVAGVVVGIMILKRGYSLGRSKKVSGVLGWALPALAIILLVFAGLAAFDSRPTFTTQTTQGAFATGDSPPAVFVKEDGVIANVLRPKGAIVTAEGSVVAATGEVLASAESVSNARPQPGGRRAPLAIALVAGLLIGVVAQRTRFCSIGGIRDAILVRRYDQLFGVAGLLIGAAVANVALGQFRLGFENQPVAHMDILGNFVAMTVASVAAMMLGGCPFRQIIVGAEGDFDGFTAVVGMLAGAGFAHWAQLTSSAAGLAPLAWPAIGVMVVILAAIALLARRSGAIARG